MTAIAPTKEALGPIVDEATQPPSSESRHPKRASKRSSIGQFRDRLGLRRVRSTSEYAVHFIFTHRAVGCLWCLILVVQILNGFQLVGFSYIYVSYAYQETSLLQYLADGFLQAPQQAFLIDNGVWIGVAYAILGGLFLLSTLSMVLGTLWARKLSFSWPLAHIIANKGSDMFNKSGFHKFFSSEPSRLTGLPGSPALLHAIRDKFHQSYSRLQVWWVSCGVRGEYFEQAMLLREAVELFYQAIQADQVSRKISRKDVNYAYTTLIVFNAMLHPILSRVYANDPPMKRFAVVFSDFFLDFVWGCLLPLWIFMPYLQLDLTKTKIDLLLERGFGSIENTQREVEQIVILSWPALLLSVFPFISAMLSLRSVKKLLKVAKRVKSWNDVTPEERIASLSLMTSQRRLAIEAAAIADPDVKPAQSLLVARCHSLLSVCGGIIALVAIVSSGVFTTQPNSKLRVWDQACRYPLTPWFATRQACAVWYLNCTQMGIQGNASELDRAFSLVDSESLIYLSLESCTNVEIPVSIAQFSKLRALAIWSSSLASWSNQSAITSQNFPALQTIVMQSVSLTDESRRLRGFVAGSWPARVEKAIFVDTDLSQLRISDLAKTWRYTHGWYCVRCGLAKFPGALFNGDELRELTIEGTPLKSIPSPGNLTLRPSLWPNLKILNLANDDQLTHLSDDVWELLATGSLEQLSIPATNISSIPSQWIVKLPPSPVIYATGSPLCHDHELRRRTSALVCNHAA